MKPQHRPQILIILDGWGYSESPDANAIYHADKPVWDKLWENHTHTFINASGTNVGLPGDQMGNSEVGHMNIGSGRVIPQDFTRISQAIDDGSFFENKNLTGACVDAANHNKAVHILGLLSDGGVHSHQDQIFALMKLADQQDISKLYLHAFLDGRDTPPRSAGTYIKDTEQFMNKLENGRIASITGRYYAMDRNNNWDRIQLAYDMLTTGKSDYRFNSASEALDAAYKRDESDEFVLPSVVLNANGEPVTIDDGDVVLYANFRADRARQLSIAFNDDDFSGFNREARPATTSFVSMTEYKEDFTFPSAFPPLVHENVLGEFLSNKGLHQLRIAETEKYAHVTFFFNGGEETVFKNEDRILIPSPDVATYDLKPEMSAYEVTDKLIEAIKSDQYDAIICNYANTDMVGHTGDFDAAVKAAEAVDVCLGRVTDAALEVGGEILITADHGNAEKMHAGGDSHEAHTAHTSNPVPLLYIGRPALATTGSGALCDIAPTMLYLMGYEQPAEMTGTSLISIDQDDTLRECIKS